jgi:CBS domain containing-hemolysin-like protein
MSEAAILSLSMVRARILVEQKYKSAEDVLFLKENIASLIAVIVVLNNSINIIGAIFVGQQVTHIFGEQWLGLGSTIITLAIIIVSEIIPKMIGERYKVRISLSLAKPLRGLMWVSRPVLGVLSKMSQSFLKKDARPKERTRSR